MDPASVQPPGDECQGMFWPNGRFIEYDPRLALLKVGRGGRGREGGRGGRDTAAHAHTCLRCCFWQSNGWGCCG